MKTTPYPENLKKFSPSNSGKLKNFLIYMLCIVCGLFPSIAKADTPYPTSVVASYNAALNKLSITVTWNWASTANSKILGAAMFADLNGDGISPTIFDNPATYNSGGNPFPAGLTAKDEFLGQLALSNIEGSATSTLFPALIDNTDNGIASAVSGFTTSTARVLFPYGINPVLSLGTSGTFTLTYTNLSVAPAKLCVVLYDVQDPGNITPSGGHSPKSSNPDHNNDNSVEKENVGTTISCTGLVTLICAFDKTEGPCQTQAAINASYAAWLASVTASGCSGTLTNNSTGAPNASGGSSIVTFTYTQTSCSSQATTTTCTATFTVTPCNKTNPDFNSTFVNIPVPGNVNTNDIVPVGSTYGTSPTLLSSPAGSSPSITMNSNGTYSFVSNIPGVYTYDVPVCVPGQIPPCPPTKLVITVLNALIISNSPVANVDIATTNMNTPVTLKSLANDAAGNSSTALVPSSVAVTIAPLNGTTSINPTNGDITYTPNTGFTGSDTLTYQVCDNQTPAKCATAKQIISVKPAGLANLTVAADDYKITNINTAATGNVKTNDSDPEGHNQTVTIQNTTIAGKGTLALAADGSYSFTPSFNYTGPVDFPYTTCDNGTPQACASATLHILVRPELPITNPDFNTTFVNVSVPGNVSTNDKVPAGTTYGTSPALVSSPAGSLPSLTMNSDGTYSFVSNLPGVYTYDVPVCVPGQVAPCPPTKLVITVLDATINTNQPVANVDIATTNFNIPVTLKTLANDAAGNIISSLVPSSVLVTVAPLHGTTSVNPANGDITYTPNAGYSGYDTLTYQVCDNQVPSKCTTAKQIITIKPAGGSNATAAADDYKITLINTPASGNVKTNDTDPENDFQTVIIQNTTIAGKGTLVLAADGSYTFTPVLNFTGPVDFPYTTCDNGTPQACASATLHILVMPVIPTPDLSPNIIASPSIMHGTTIFNVIVETFEVMNTPTNGSQIMIRIPKDPRVTFAYNSAASMIGGNAVNNSVWSYDGSNPLFHIFTSNTVIEAFGVSKFGFVAIFTPGQTQGKYTLSASINSGSGGETKTDNNQDAEVLDYFIN